MGIFAGLFFVMAIIIILGVTAYVIAAIGLYNLAKNNGLEDKAILAWIPLANFWLLSLLIGDIVWGEKRLPSIAVIGAYIVISYVASKIRTDFRTISLLFNLAGAVLVYVIYFELYRRVPKIQNKEVFAIVSAIIPFVFPIMLIIHRNEKLVEVEEIDYSNYTRRNT